MFVSSWATAAVVGDGDDDVIAFHNRRLCTTERKQLATSTTEKLALSLVNVFVANVFGSGDGGGDCDKNICSSNVSSLQKFVKQLGE